MAIKLFNKSTPSVRAIPIENSYFSSKLLNYIERVNFKGKFKTKFFSQVNTNLKVGDKVYIVNGTYDTQKLVQKNPLKKNSVGYTVLDIQDCSIILDIDYSGNLPNMNDSLDSFIKVYTANDQKELDGYYYNYFSFNYTGTTNSVSNYLGSGYNTLLYISTPGLTFGTYLGTVSATNSFYKLYSGNWTNVGAQFLSNSITGLTGNNGNLMVLGDSFTYSGIRYNRHQVYTYSNSNWKINSDYNEALITKANFRGGSFSSGQFNDGVYGSYDKKIKWNGASWNSGVLLNTDWISGKMTSKSDTSTNNKVFYTILDNGIAKQNIDTNNYFGNGLNFAISSNFIGGSIVNGNIERSEFIDNSNTYSVVPSDIFGVTFSSKIVLSGGKYSYSNFTNVIVNNSTLYNSNFHNSIANTSNFYDSYSYESTLNNSNWNSDGVKFLDYDVQSFIEKSDFFYTGIPTLHRLYKFYISESDYMKLKNSDPIYIKDLIFGQVQLDHEFSREFRLNLASTNLNPSGSSTVGNDNIKTKLSTASDNKYRVDAIAFDTTSADYRNTYSLNQKSGYSIDIIHFVTRADSLINPSLLTLNNGNPNYIRDASSAKVYNSAFKSGLFKGGNWNSGNHKNGYSIVRRTTSSPAPVIKDYAITMTGSVPYDMTVGISYQNSEFTVPVNNSLLYLDGVYIVGTETHSISGWYRVKSSTFTNSLVYYVQLNLKDEFINIPTVITFSGYPNNKFESEYSNLDNIRATNAYLSPILITGSNINKGEFDRVNFYNTNFNSNVNVSSELNSQLEINNLKIGYNLFNPNQITDNYYNNQFIYNSVFDKQTISGGLVYNSIFIDNTINSAVLKNNYWYKGTFNSGKFIDSNNNANILDIVYSTTVSNIWYCGKFNSGDFVKSYWTSGTASGGNFNNSIITAINGPTFLQNTVIGNPNLDVTQTIVNSYPSFSDPYEMFNIPTNTIYISNSVINNAVIGGKTIMSDNTMNSGIIHGTNIINQRAPVWYSGIFNGGQFSGSSLWINGLFNGGKFTATGGYVFSGFGNATASYGWLGGTFSGGIFGDTETISQNFASIYRPSWYDGVFTGGKFKGRVWRTGLFLGGEFEGYAGSMSAINNQDSFNQLFHPNYGSASMYGIWLDGTVSDSIKRVSLNNVRSNEFEIKRIRTLNTDPIKFSNMLWVNGTFSNSLATINNSIWVNGNFVDGQFINSNFNPYVVRYDYLNYATASINYYTFNLTNTCVWNNGVLDNSNFWISEWNGGLFKSGTMSGSRFNKGVSNYMSAYNVIWNGGRWRNGTWYGSDFIFSTASSNIVQRGLPPIQQTYVALTASILQGGALKDIMTQQSIRHGGSQSYHIWNVFNTALNNYATVSNTEIINGLISSTATGAFTIGSVSMFGYTGTFNILPQVGFTYSFTTGSNTTFAKIGNGAFIKGDWDTGVWNNGLRLDTSFNGKNLINKFDTVVNTYQSDVNKWTLLIQGATFSSAITTGDSVTLGNIVLLDINGRRKQYQKKAIVVYTDNVQHVIGVELNIDFPIRTIQKDSENHKIYLTSKNWLNGAFLSGKFNGVWIDGMVKSYPRLTTFTESHWVGGKFEGGSFYAAPSNTVGTYSTATYSTSVIQSGYFDGLVDPTKTTNRIKTWLYFNRYNTPGLQTYDTSLVSRYFAYTTTLDVLEMEYRDKSSAIYNSMSDLILSYGTKWTKYDYFVPTTQSSLDIGGMVINDTEYANFGGGIVTNNYPAPQITRTLQVYHDYNPSNTTTLIDGINLYPTASSYRYMGHLAKRQVGPRRYGVFEFTIGKNDSYTNDSGFVRSFGNNTHDYLGYTDTNTLPQDHVFQIFEYNGYDSPSVMYDNLSNPSNFGLKNLQFYELDRIPYVDINNTVPAYEYVLPSIPFAATSPFIDFTNNEFSSGNNIQINYDSIVSTASLVINTGNPVFLPNPNGPVGGS